MHVHVTSTESNYDDLTKKAFLLYCSFFFIKKCAGFEFANKNYSTSNLQIAESVDSLYNKSLIQYSFLYFWIVGHWEKLVEYTSLFLPFSNYSPFFVSLFQRLLFKQVHAGQKENYIDLFICRYFRRRRRR